MNSRAKHVSECAKRFSVSSKDLIDLISLFRESIDSMSESSSVNASSNAEKLRLKPGGIRDPSTDRFIKAFTPPPKKKSAFGTKKSKNTKGKSKDLAIGNNGMTTKLKNTGQELQTCISESVGKIQSIGSKSPAASRANGLPKSEPSFSRSSSSMSFEIPEDEDFQSTKVRVSLQQTRIAIGKKRKLQQDVLDELGDDLNEAKALSLSLKRDSRSAVAEIEEDDNRNRVTTTSIVLSSASSRSSAEPDTYTRVAEKCPNYSKMALDDLKRIASDFGLRTNTPRRLIEHQLKTIWEQTHKISKPKDSTCQDSDKVPSQKVSETLAIQLRDYIRSQPTLYEPILCYRVLDFESTYARICAAIPSCKKTMLRQFFDSEGIVYTSFHS
ncbi:hypothetical protein LPJ64_005777 [Coemansia asiatica]|uniref:Structure-specific endonuclease subunit SLX4 n=1 Tax=Coemansia asiatica TaxID=1052880 RepID=A0A9W7XH14_9FUNG|nr:hypothetical protein LPJ64_005777 [Coemansia asiatica]